MFTNPILKILCSSPPIWECRGNSVLFLILLWCRFVPIWYAVLYWIHFLHGFSISLLALLRKLWTMKNKKAVGFEFPMCWYRQLWCAKLRKFPFLSRIFCCALELKNKELKKVFVFSFNGCLILWSTHYSITVILWSTHYSIPVSANLKFKGCCGRDLPYQLI